MTKYPSGSYSPSSPAREAILELVCGYSSAVRSRKLLVILQAFTDDSVGRMGGRHYVLAAYVQTADVWLSFSDDWQAVLDASPKIEYFKMSEAHGKTGQFSGWDEKPVKDKIAALAKVIKQHSPWSFEARL